MDILSADKAVKQMIRDADCGDCEWADTHHGISCYMFEDRGDCYVKRPRKRPPEAPWPKNTLKPATC